MAKLTHLDDKGKARMVDVGSKPITKRVAVASGRVIMKAETLRRITQNKIEKGDVLAVARVAGIMAAKRTSDFIPMCHPLSIENVEIKFKQDMEKTEIKILTTVKYTGKTGVEMEALFATAAAALTIYDMCKSGDREMIISEIKLLQKSGGKSGTFIRREE